MNNVIAKAALCACLLSTAAMAQSDYRFGACSGGYDIYSSGASATAGAMTIPVGTPVQSNAQIAMGQCGREMVLEAQGMSMVLYQDVMDERSYTGSLQAGDGVDREVTLRVGEDRNLRGAIVAKDPNMSVTRPLWFMLTDPQETRFEDCEDDAPEPFTPRGLTAEAAAVTQLLSDQGFVPAEGLSYADYITTDAANPESSQVQMRVSQDGTILPRHEIAVQQLDAESAYCTSDTWLEPAHSILEFKVEYADDDPFVFARQIDIASSRITAQVEGTPTVVGEGALASGMQSAWTGLAPVVSGMSDGVAR